MNRTSAEQAIFLTPYPESFPEFKWSRGDRVLSLEFEGGLQPDRTYVLTVGTGVSDQRGVRLASAFSWAFATGDSIHRGSVSGSVWDSRFAPVAGITVGVFPLGAGGRPDPTRDYPSYVTQSGRGGLFALGYLPDGAYRLFAWRDADNDGLVGPTEPLGIATGDIRVKGGGSNRVPRVCLGREDRAAPLLERVRPLDRGRIELSFSEPVDSVSVSITGMDVGAPAVDCWPLVLPRASARLGVRCSGLVPGRAYGASISARDRAGNVGRWFADTTSFVASGQADTTRPRVDEIRGNRGIPPGSGIGFTLWLSDAVTPGEAQVALKGSGSARVEGVWSQPHANVVNFVSETPMGANSGEWEVPLNGLRDMNGNPLADTLSVIVSPLRADSLGELSGTVADAGRGNALRVVARSMQTNDTFTAVISDSGVWVIEGIPAGDYEVFAWTDTDGDGKWSPGSLAPFLPAERWAIARTATVRPRWTTTGVGITFE